MKAAQKARAGMLAREPGWVTRLRASTWRHKYVFWFVVAWTAIVAALWLLNDLLG